jgi:hypothetical protein
LKIDDENNLKKYKNIFDQVPNNITVMGCVNKNNDTNIIIPDIRGKDFYHMDCSDYDKSKQKEINGCIINDCLSCPPFDLSNHFCNDWNKYFYKIENDPLNTDGYNNYYKDPKGYYFDIKDSLYKKCYHSCERCDKEGNDLLHNCLICNNNFPVEIKINNSLNCYEKCNFNYYFDNESNYQCTNDLSCPEGYYPSSIQGKNECIKGYIKHESTHIIIKEFPTTELEKTIINKSPSQIISNKVIQNTAITIQNNVTMEDLKNLIQDIINFEKNDTKEITKE